MFERLIWIVPVAVAAAGLWRPRAGLVVLAAALPLFGSPPGGPYLEALDVAGIAAIATAWRRGRAPRSPLGWPAVAFVVVSLVSLVPSPYQPPSWRPSVLVALAGALPGVESWSALYTWRAAADLVLGWGLFVAVRRAFAGSSLRPLALAFTIGLVTTLVVGLGAFAGLLDLGGYRPLHGGVGPPHRLHSLFFLSGWLAEYIVLVTPVALMALLGMGRWRPYLPLSLLSLAAACLALTQQRGGWIAAAAQMILWAAFGLRRRAHLDLRRAGLAAAAAATLALAVLLASGGGLTPLLERARSVNAGLGARAQLAAAAVEMVGERPLLGWGLGSYTPAYDLLDPRGSPGALRFRGTAHNLYLNVAAERGALGLVGLGLVGWALALCLRRSDLAREPLAMALALSLFGAAVYGLFQYMFYLRSIAWALWILLGCVALTAPGRRAPRLERAAAALVIGGLLLVPFRLAFNQPPPFAGNRGFGWHETNLAGGFRWTGGFAAQRLRWEGEVLVLSLANGHPRAAERPVTVAVGVDGEILARLTVAGGWQEHRFELGPPRREWLVLTLEAHPTFRPFSDYRAYPALPESTDIRSLGVAVRGIRFAGAGAA